MEQKNIQKVKHTLLTKSLAQPYNLVAFAFKLFDRYETKK